MLKKYDELQKKLLSYGLTNSSVLGRHMGIMDDAADAIEDLQTHISRVAEFDFMLSYVQESCFDEEICRDWLRMLWTVYCLHHGLEVDTSDYDNDLLELWSKLTETSDGTSDWSDFSSFDHFMCTYLM
jgi:hypothetical protein